MKKEKSILLNSTHLYAMQEGIYVIFISEKSALCNVMGPH